MLFIRVGERITGDSAVFDPDDPVSNSGDFRIVGNHHNGLAELPAGLFQQSDDILTGPAVQIAGGLVGKNDRWFCGERPCDGDALLLSAGEAAGQTVKFSLKSQQADQTHDKVLIGSAVVQSDRKDNIFPYVQHWDEIIILKDKTDMSAPEHSRSLVSQVGESGAVDGDAAFIRLIQSAQHVEER